MKQDADARVSVLAAEVKRLRRRLAELEGKSVSVDAEAQTLGEVQHLRTVEAVAQRHLLEGLFNAATEAVLLIGADGLIRAVNETTAQRLGMKREDLVGLHVEEVPPEAIPPDVLQGRIKAIRGVVASGKPVRFEDRRGQDVVDNHMVPVFDDAGKVTQVAIFARDITEEKRTVAELRKFKAISDGAGYGTAILDPQGTVSYVNDAAARMLGYEPAEMIGKSYLAFYREEQAGQAQRRFEQLLKEGSLLGVEIWQTKKDGTPVLALMNGTVVRDNRGHPQFLGITAFDITVSRQLETRLGEYREKMARAEKLASVGTLSAALAHEITQPLSVIQLSVQNALASLDGKPRRKLLRDLLTSASAAASRAASLVDHFRRFARKSTGRRHTTVCLAEVAEMVAELFRNGAEQVPIEVVLKGLDTLPDIVFDWRDAEQLFFALVQNAVQAAGRKRKHRLVIRGAVKDGCVELRFCDDCGGIPPEHLESLFEPFFSTKPAGESTGLGLTIAREIVSQAGGSIRAETKYGTGSTFIVTCPVESAEVHP